MPRSDARLERIGAALFVALLIGISAWYLAPSIFRAWFFMTDEWMVAGEAIRFTNLDFRQHFFDQPETPLISLTAAAWALVWAAGRIAGLAPPSINDFSYHHLPLLFEISRTISFLPGLIAIALMFVVASRLTNRAGGCVAAMLVAMSRSFSMEESFIRPEPMAVCLLLLGIWCLLRGIDPRDSERAAGRFRTEARWIFAAGCCAGLAAAARFHSITASVPLLVLILVSSGWPAPVYARRLAAYWRCTVWSVFAGAIAAMIAIKTGLLAATAPGKMIAQAWPRGFDDLFALSGVTAALIAAIAASGYVRRSAWISRRLLHPRMLMLAAGTAAGVLAGTPTILWGARPVLESIQMYTTTYLDRDHLHWPLLRHLGFLFSYYRNVAAPDWLSASLILAGAALIVIRRDRKLLPFLLSAPLFFLFRPLNTVVWPHHVLLWLPMIAMVAGYGVARAYDRLGSMARLARWRTVMLGAFLAAMFAVMNLGPRAVAARTAGEEQRMHSIAQATAWIHAHAEPGSAVAIAYKCFNADIFLQWMRSLGVPVPPDDDRRRYLIWWGEHSALENRRGYACATPADIDSIKRLLDLREPGQGSDPYTDEGFTRVRTFGANAGEVDVFRFDFSHGASRADSEGN